MLRYLLELWSLLPTQDRAKREARIRFSNRTFWVKRSRPYGADEVESVARLHYQVDALDPESPAIHTPGDRFLYLMSLSPDCFRRLKPGGAQGGVEAGQKADNAADGWRERGSEGVEHRRPDLVG